MENTSLFDAFTTILKRDLTLAFRNLHELANPLIFFVIVISLFPMGVSPASSILATIAPGVLWVAALLAALLSLDMLFRADYDDGSLEQMVLSSHSLSVLVLAKIIAHWLVTGIPLLILSPLLAVLLFLPDEAMLTLIVTLAIGTPLLSLIGAIGMGLVVGLRRGGMLLALLVLPLYIPVLIFGAGAVDAAAAGLAVTGQLYILGAMLMLAISLAPMATAAALRISLT